MDFDTAAATLVEKARAGTLAEAEFYDIVGLAHHPILKMVVPKWMLPENRSAMLVEDKLDLDAIVRAPLLREHFIQQVSYAIFTTEYLDSLARLLEGQRVLEVCARTGVLRSLMDDRGIDWFCSDIAPQAPWVECADAMKSWHTWRPDVVFASWISPGSDLDQQLAAVVPCVFVVEGCTGTTEEGFYDNPAYEVTRARDIEGFCDVANWEGIRDKTVITVPKGASSPFRR